MTDNNTKKVVFITGGTSGIGFATAKKYLEKGYRVALGSIDSKAVVDEAINHLQEYGEVKFYHLDVSSSDNCQAVIHKTITDFGQIDILVNAAGVVGNLDPIYETDLSDVYNTIQVNLMGTIYMAYYSAKYMAKSRSGVIINIGSISGFMATNHGIGYHGSKGGLNMATKVMAEELSSYNIRCIGIAPGSVRTKMQPVNTESKAASLLLKNRLIEPEEIANIVYLLSLDEASAVNGSVVMADDGYCSFKQQTDLFY